MKLTIAGREVLRPVEVVEKYLSKHSGTVRAYDGLAGRIDRIDQAAIKASRVISSRISEAEGAHLITILDTVDWSGVPRGASLVDADATLEGGLYDEAARVYNYVLSRSERGISHAKVSKLLYLLRPALFPILDSRLRHIYRAVAREAARDVTAVRANFPYKYAYWEAIRRDLVANEEPLDQVRRDLLSGTGSNVAQLTASLTPLRLLDVVTWHA